MKPFILFIRGALLLSLTANAQQTGSLAPTALEAERTRIQSERDREEELFEKTIATCYQRFAVNDCVREAKAKRRAVLDRLLREEAFIKDAQRRQKGADQIKRLEEKAQTRPVPQESGRQDDQVGPAGRQSELAEKTRAAPIPSANQTPDKKPPTQTGASGRPTAQSREEARKIFEEKQRQAQERKDQRDRALAEKAGKPSHPLPIPP
jgi:hypothetical protein